MNIKIKPLAITFLLFFNIASFADEQLQPLEFSGYDFSTNKPFKFNQFKGKIIYLDFWASWCPPCLESMPFMEKLYQQYKAQGFEIIAVNIDEHKEDASKFLDLHPISYTNLYDPQGKIGKRFKVRSMPTAFLIDQDGNVIYKHVGFNQKYSIKLEEALKGYLSNLGYKKTVTKK